MINSNINKLILNDCTFENFDLSDFNKISERTKPLDLLISSPNINLLLFGLREKGIKYEINVVLSKKQSIDLNAEVKLNFGGITSIVCPQCIFDIEIFMFNLNNSLENLNIYLIESKVLINTQLNLEYDLIKQYTLVNTENCPEPCKCQFNPLLIELSINCENKNLTNIPEIPYTSRINEIDSIELNLMNNPLTNINFLNQDDRIVKLLRFFYFNWKGITQIEFAGKPNKLTRSFEGGLADRNAKTPAEYMLEKPMNTISQALRSLACDSKCLNIGNGSK